MAGGWHRRLHPVPALRRVEPVEVAIEHELRSRQPHRHFVLGQRLDRIECLEIFVWSQTHSNVHI
jgi:hypothetical protein